MFGLKSSMQVGCHDFTQFSVTPSVCFIVEITDLSKNCGMLVKSWLE